MKKETKMFYLINCSKTRIKILLLILCLLGYTSFSNAQQPNMLVNWAKCMNNSAPFSGGAYGQASTVDASGNFYVAGFYQGTIDFDPGAGTAPLTSVGGLDVFFAKYDINGNYVLAKSIGGTHATGDYVHAIAVDASNNIYLGGQFFGTTDFDPGAGVANLTATIQSDGYVAKYDAAGNFVYVNHIVGNDYEVVRGLATDLSGNVVVAAYFYAGVSINTGGGTTNLLSNGSYDALLIKFDAAGNTVFANRFGNYSLDNGYAVGTDASGNVYIAGGYTVSIDFGAGFISATGGGAYDVYVAKFSPTGTYIYGKVFGGTGEDWCNGMKVDASGNAYLTGHFSTSVDFDPGAGTATLTTAGNKDAYLLKLDNNGNYVYAKGMGGSGDDHSNAVSVDGNGNVFITGSFTSTLADFDPGAGVANLASAGAHDAYIAKYDASGNYLYARKFGASAGDDVGAGISTYGNYNVFVTGYFTGVVDFDPEAGVNNLGTTGTQNAFMIRLTNDFEITASAGSNGNVTPAGTTLVFAETNQSYNITPNAGYCINDVLIDGVSVGAVSSYSFTSVISNHTISATFTPAPHWYKDNDNDGYGDPAVDSIACAQPVGYLSDNTDCNDNYNLEHPGQIWFIDADGDGYGTGANVTQCTRATDGYVAAEIIATTGDCNDASNTIHPGVTEIICNGIDENCNGMADDIGVASTAATGITTTATYNQICTGGSTSLILSGGSLGTSASWVWYEGGCGTGASIGSGTSITIAPVTNGPHQYFVRAEGGCTSTACVSITINVISLSPSNTIHYTAGLTDGCVGAPSSVISVNAAANCTFYRWSSAQSGARFNGNPSPFETTTPTVNLSFVSLPPAGTSGWSICVFAGNACGNTNTICTWVRATVSMPSSISGSVIGCPVSTANPYSSAPVAGAASYQWSATGGIVINGNGVQAITVDFPAGFVSGTLSVRGQTACGYNGPYRTININRAPALPASIAGPSYPCPNGTSTYSVAAIAGAANYTWTTTVPGAVVTGTSNTCSIAFPAVIPAGSSVSVVANSSCSFPSAIRSKGIASGLPGVPSNIIGPASGQCGATGVSYTITPVANTTGYNWTASCGTIQGPNNLSGLSIDWPASFTSCTLTVSASNACGSGGTRALFVAGVPATPGVLSGNVAPCAGSVEIYSGSSNGATSYNWTIPAGSAILGPVNGPSIILQWGSTSGNVSAQAVNSCGVSSFRALPCVISCRQSQVSGSASGLNAEVYPNPATEKATVKFSAAFAAQFKLSMTNVLGQSIMTTEIAATEGTNMIYLDLNNVAKGVYMINIMSGDNNEQIRVVIQ